MHRVVVREMTTGPLIIVSESPRILPPTTKRTGSALIMCGRKPKLQTSEGPSAVVTTSIVR